MDAVAIAPDGTWLATTSGDQTARIWAVDGLPAAGNGKRARDAVRPPEAAASGGEKAAASGTGQAKHRAGEKAGSPGTPTRRGTGGQGGRGYDRRECR